MSTENTHTGHGHGGCCGGGKAAAPTLAELERQLHALWARVQEERAKQVQATEPARKKGCCCG
ncbi:hypothetical protein WOC76_10580 [Methylocystis sp. IM3]|jgi:hypothetical protein|uniref:hypothetical protein n=1 Tax=unclassified Methylocystis TaxID=2625913 RepID=UPI0026A678A4